MNTHQEFREAINEERENLTRLSEYWNAKINSDTVVSKDFQGRIRAAVGKTRLLLSEKFKQLESLVDQSENKTSEKEISMNDLHGFWELVLIQVNEIKDMFRRLEMFQNRPREIDHYKDSLKGDSKSKSLSKNKSSSDALEQTERKIKEITEKDKNGTSDAKMDKASLSDL